MTVVVNEAHYATSTQIQIRITITENGESESVIMDYPTGVTEIDTAYTTWAASNTPTAYRAISADTKRDQRRRERTEEFKQTLDMVNPLWLASLTDAERAALSAWRTAWLNYPNDLRTTRPERPMMFGR